MDDAGFAPRPPFSAMLHTVNGVPIVRVFGEVCIATRERFEDALGQAFSSAEAPGLLVVDLTEVSFMDSEGLKTIFGVIKEVRRGAGEVRVVARRGPVTRLLEITGTEATLRLYPSVAQATTR